MNAIITKIPTKNLDIGFQPLGVNSHAQKQKNK